MIDRHPLEAVAARVHAAYLADPRPDVRETVRALARRNLPLAAAAETETLTELVVARVQGLGPLESLLCDPDVTEVMVNGGREVWVERFGELEHVSDLEPEEAARVIERVVGPLGLRIDRSSPMVDARLPDGARVHAVIPPVAIDGPCLTIRRFGARAIDLERFCVPVVAAVLVEAVRARRNVIVSGGTGSGKTTLLNALAAHIDATARVVTIEDAAELRLRLPHVVRLEARPVNLDGGAAVTIRQLVRGALRMRPDRIVVGEVRGGEALDMVQAMNTGHEGSLSTCHSNTPLDALRRLETMILFAESGLPLDAVRSQLGSAIDLVVQVARRPGGGRAVVEVAEVDPSGSSTRPIVLGDEVVASMDRPVRSW